MNTLKPTASNPSGIQVTLESVKKMSDEELKIEVAKLAGFKNVLSGNFSDVWADDPNFTAGCGRQEVPDYPHDLNAVHEVEKLLQDRGLCVEYVNQLRDGAIAPGTLSRYGLVRATARQRCEALVLCLSPDVAAPNALKR